MAINGEEEGTLVISEKQTEEKEDWGELGLPPLGLGFGCL